MKYHNNNYSIGTTHIASVNLILLHSYKLIAAVFLLVVNHTVIASTLKLENSETIYQAHASMRIWEDKQADWDLDTFLQKQKYQPSLKLTTETPNFGFTNAAIWATVQVVNKTEKQHVWLSEIGFTGMDHIDLYYQNNESEWQLNAQVATTLSANVMLNTATQS